MTTRSEAARHLRLLSIFHYVVGGLAAIFACIPIIHFLVGIAMITGWGEFGDQGAEAGLFGWFFAVLGGGFVLAGMAFAVCLVLAGRYIAQKRRYTFCLVMAGVSCMFMPFGTVLGVFTLIVLLGDPAKELFGEAPSAAPEVTAP